MPWTVDSRNSISALYRQYRESFTLKGTMFLKDSNRVEITKIKPREEVLLICLLPKRGLLQLQVMAERAPIVNGLPARDLRHFDILIMHNIHSYIAAGK
jgi:hypothetical protein